MIKFRHKGNFSKFDSYTERLLEVIRLGRLDKYGREGVEALMSATPRDTGKTAESWYYTITRKKEKVTINFSNSNIPDGVPIAVILQYGHATRDGGWVEGRDYINPAIQPIFDKIAKNAWAEVTKL